VLRDGKTFEGKGEQEPHWLKAGSLRQEAGQLTGWNHVTAGGFGWGMDSTSDVAVFQWVVEKGAAYELVAKHERAGVVRMTIQV
jgi:hypothetical protein